MLFTRGGTRLFFSGKADTVKNQLNSFCLIFSCRKIKFFQETPDSCTRVETRRKKNNSMHKTSKMQNVYVGPESGAPKKRSDCKTFEILINGMVGKNKIEFTVH